MRRSASRHGRSIFVALIVAAMAAVSVPNASASVTYFQGFETDAAGWLGGTVTRVANGYTNGGGYADGVQSSSGDYHGRMSVDRALCTTDAAGGGPVNSCSGPFTRWGGYNTNWLGGYTTELDIYLDAAYAAAHPDSYSGTDSRFDWVSAINDATGAHLRDFAFNAGTGPNLNAPTVCAGGGFWVAGSTNSTRSGADPYDPGKDPKCVTGSGWYTFKHTFSDAGGLLAVDFDILNPGSSTPAACVDSTGTTVACHWRIVTSDEIASVGCNRYGWFSNQELADLPIDNQRMGGCGVAVAQAPPVIAVTKTASPTSRPAPGGDFTFSVSVANTTPGVVTLATLVDDVYGDLNGKGTCATGSAIAASASYDCSFVGTFTGTSGASETDTITATVADATSTVGSGSGSATVTITEAAPAPAPTGVLEICKRADNANGAVTGNFVFTVQSRQVVVPVGSCSGPLTVLAGNVTVSEQPNNATRLSACLTKPVTRLQRCDPAAREAIVEVVPGGVAAETVLFITNKVAATVSTGGVKVCKIAGPGVAIGTNYSFTVGGKAVTVAAGPADQGGYCKIVSGFTRGTNVSVTEASRAGTHVSAISVKPLTRQVSKSVANRTATVTVSSTLTVVSFTNRT